MKFEDFLKAELEKPAGEWYTKDGNSERAVVCRGLLGEILWQYKNYPKAFASTIKCFDGFDTPLGWFVSTPCMIILSPLLPIIWGFHWYNKSIEAFKDRHKAIFPKD